MDNTASMGMGDPTKHMKENPLGEWKRKDFAVLCFVESLGVPTEELSDYANVFIGTAFPWYGEAGEEVQTMGRWVGS